MRQRIFNVLAGVLCCFLFAACSQDMVYDEETSLRTRVNTGVVYMQNFTPAGNEAVGTVVMLTDKRDGIVYRCIKMADGRWWMGENLRGRFGNYVEGKPTETYGLLYDEKTSEDYVPEGWRIPSNGEWEALGEALGGKDVAGGKMKQAGIPDWSTPDSGTDDNSGWNGLPGGCCHTPAGTWGFWRSENGGIAYYLVSPAYSLNGPDYWSKYLSVRCVLQERTTIHYMQTFMPKGTEAVGTEVMLTDKRDNAVYRCIKMADGRWWMGENLKYNVTGSVVYNNEVPNLETYGRLYKWQEAMDAIPENWNMPADDEWKALEMALGMTQADADAATAWRNSGNVGTQLKENGSSGMGLLLSGYQHSNGAFFYLGTYGRYWTSTEVGSANAFDRDVYSTKAGVYRGSFGKAYRYSVRCVLQESGRDQYMQTFVPNPADPIGTEINLRDERDGIVYRCIKMADGRWWMGENLKYSIDGSSLYDNNPDNLETYGRLYKWQAAMNAVPESWHLPSDEDWITLEKALGMSQEDAMKTSWRGGKNEIGRKLRRGGISGLNLLLGGLGFSNGYSSIDGHGVYWTSTEYGLSGAWERRVSVGLMEVCRIGGTIKECDLSVRFVLNQ